MNITRNHPRFSAVTDPGRPNVCDGFIQCLNSHQVRKQSQEQQKARHFFRQIMTFYPDNLRQWREALHKRGVNKQCWRLLNGPFNGCRVAIMQDGLQRHIQIICRTQQNADELQELKPLLESACSGPWLDVLVTIEVENETSLHAGVDSVEPPHW